MEKQLFETKGTKDSALGALVLVALIIAIVLLGVSLLIKGKFVGPWFIYAAVSVVLFVILRFVGNYCEVQLRVLKNEKGEVFVAVEGKAINSKFVVGEYTYWQYTKFQGPKYGSSLFLKALINSASGSSRVILTDTRMPGREANDWPIYNQEINTGEDQIIIAQIEEFITALNEA